MDRIKEKNYRLSRNFHKTFIPERRYIHAILQFASTGKSGDIQSIASATGIPTGTSSGKVKPTIDYSRGMGLITLTESSMGKTVKTPQLTPFGRMVLLEDPFLKESVTQWIAHINLCGPSCGADIWYKVFCLGSHTLGTQFQKSQLDSYLKNKYGVQKGNLIGPLVRMYDDPASFSSCGALKETKLTINRKTAPISEEYLWGYGAWILCTIEQFFPGTTQVTVTDLDRMAGWRTIPGWGIDASQQLLRMLEQKGILTVERHMNPWIIQCRENSNNLWKKIYNDLL